MKIVMLYKPNTERERLALNYVRDFKMRTGKDLPLTDMDSPEGAQICRTYDIMDHPAILVTTDGGVLQNIWVGEQLPSMNEVSYYMDSQA